MLHQQLKDDLLQLIDNIDAPHLIVRIVRNELNQGLGTNVLQVEQAFDRLAVILKPDHLQDRLHRELSIPLQDHQVVVGL